MKNANALSADYRFGEWGPAYLIEGEAAAMGVLLLRPGDAMENHFHEHCDESFIVLEGECDLWIDCEEKHVMTFGDVYQSQPGEMHYLVNNSQADFRCIFIKTPASPGDTIPVPWTPGEPKPEAAQ